MTTHPALVQSAVRMYDVWHTATVAHTYTHTLPILEYRTRESGRHTVACGDCLTGERGGKKRKHKLGWQDRQGELLRPEQRGGGDGLVV